MSDAAFYTTLTVAVALLLLGVGPTSTRARRAVHRVTRALRRRAPLEITRLQMTVTRLRADARALATRLQRVELAARAVADVDYPPHPTDDFVDEWGHCLPPCLRCDLRRALSTAPRRKVLIPVTPRFGVVREDSRR